MKVSAKGLASVTFESGLVPAARQAELETLIKDFIKASDATN